MKQHFLFINNFQADDGLLLTLEKHLVTGTVRHVRVDKSVQFHEADQLSLILADQLVSNYELDLKARNQSQLMKAARYAVEEKFPGRLEEYHIVTHKNSRRGVSVRAIKQQRLQELLEHFSHIGLKADNVFVESDLLNQNITTLLFNENEATLSGHDLEQTYEFDNALIPMIGERIFNKLGNSQELQIIYNSGQELIVEALENQTPSNLRLKKIIKNDRYYESLCQNQRFGINLLSGEFADASSNQNETSYWKYPAWLAAASILVFSGGLLAQNLLLENRNNQQEKQLLENYTTIFPGSSKPNDAVDLENKLKSKARQSKNSGSVELRIGALELLELSANAARDTPVQIIGLNIEQNSAELLVSGQSVEILNTFKNAVETQLDQAQKLSMDSVTSKDDEYQGKISIR